MSDASLLQRLTATTDAQVFAQKAELAAFSQFSGAGAPPVPPLAAVAPAYASQIQAILAFCRAENVRVCVRGGGTGPMPVFPPAPWLVLLTARLNRILEIDRGAMLARAQAGAGWYQLARQAERAGMYLPFWPAVNNGATVGGCLAANAVNPGTGKYGPAGNYARLLKIQTAGLGELCCHAQNGSCGQLAASLPLAPLFCGSSGALGLIAEAVLRLLPLPACRQTLLCRFEDEQAAAAAAVELAGAAPLPAALAFLDAASSERAALGKSPCLLLTYEGNREEVAAGGEIAAGAIPLDAGFAAESWLKYSALATAFASCEPRRMRESLGCPPARFPAMLEACRQIGAARGVRLAIFGVPAAARFEIMIFYDSRAAAEAAARDIFTLELTLNSLMTGAPEEASREQWLGRRDAGTAISAGIARVFDAQGIFAWRIAR